MEHECIQKGVIERLVNRLEYVEKWEERQNGSLLRLEKKVDSIKTWLIGLLTSVIASMFIYIFTNLRG